MAETEILLRTCDPKLSLLRLSRELLVSSKQTELVGFSTVTEVDLCSRMVSQENTVVEHAYPDYQSTEQMLFFTRVHPFPRAEPK